MKAWTRNTNSRPSKMVECEVDEEIIRRTPFDSEYYTMVHDAGNQDAAYETAEKLQDETGHMHVANSGKVFRTLDAKTITL